MATRAPSPRAGRAHSGRSADAQRWTRTPLRGATAARSSTAAVRGGKGPERWGAPGCRSDAAQVRAAGPGAARPRAARNEVCRRGARRVRGVSWHRGRRFIFRTSESKREGAGGGARSTGRTGGRRVCSVTATLGKWLRGRCLSAPPRERRSSRGKAAARTGARADGSLVCSAARLFPDTRVTALSGRRGS